MRIEGHALPLRLNSMKYFQIEHWSYLTLSYLVTDIEMFNQMTCDVMTWPNVSCTKLPWLYDLVYHMTWNSCMRIWWQVLS